MRIVKIVVPFSLALLVSSSEASVADCAAQKVEAMARACTHLLGAEARFLSNRNEAGLERRHALVDGRVDDAWASAEAGGGPACVDATERSGVAVQRLANAIARVGALAPGPVCGRKLLRLLRSPCRQAAALEAVALRDPSEAEVERARVISRIRRRILSRWSASGCAGSPTGEEAVRAAFRVAGVAAGNATSRTFRDLGDAVGLPIGVAIEPHEVSASEVYRQRLEHESSSLTAENVMKWGAIHPAPQTWNFGPADAIVNRAEASGARVRGHTLVWGALQLPAYVRNASTAAELEIYLADHIAGVVGRYAGRVEQWDVLNEPLSGILDPPTSDGLDDNVFRRLLGPGYIELALDLARAADPSAKLYVNENGVHVPGPRQERFFQLIQALIQAGAPIDGVGFQAHVGIAPPAVYTDWSTLEASIRRFADLGLDVELTELDVSLVFRPGSLATRLEQQERDYRDIFEACLRVSGCRGVTMWGLSDQYTWLRSFFGFDDYPLPFGDAWERKPAYFGVRAALFAGWLGQPES